MKKVLLFAVVVAGLGFTSCSKSACECTTNGETTKTEDVEQEECDAASEILEAFDAGSCEMV
jgi:hypothetical protein